MKKAAKLSILAVFLGFITLFFLGNLVTPDKDFSQQENRYLQQKPAFSLQSLFSGDYTKQFESFTTDQFLFRDGWITIKARCELLTGKTENNGVYYCGDDILISRFDAPSSETIEEDISYLNALVDNVDVPVYFALIPGAAEVQSDNLPANAPCDSQADVIAQAYDLSRATNVDMLSALSPHKDEYIFYRTDHHWTSLGAFYGYNALRDAWGLGSADIGAYARQTVSDSFYGTAYSSSGFSWVAPDTIETFVPDDGSVLITNYNSSQPVQTRLYDTSFLSVKDKYAFFLGGNTPRLTVETGHSDKPSLLILRDSYTDSLLPFLLEDFSRIDLLDLRYYRSSLAQYVADGDFDMVLVMYSVSNFSTDTNLFLLSM
jgi:hypothetical protein